LEKKISEQLGPARKYFLTIAISVWSLSFLAAIVSFIKRGIVGLLAPMAAAFGVAFLFLIFELILRSRIRREWVVKDDGLVLTTKLKTEMILWNQVRQIVVCRHGLLIGWQDRTPVEGKFGDFLRKAFLYLDAAQKHDLLVLFESKGIT